MVNCKTVKSDVEKEITIKHPKMYGRVLDPSNIWLTEDELKFKSMSKFVRVCV